MNREQFISFLDKPEALRESDGVLLAGLLKEFPYFQTAHLLYAKCLHNQKSVHYNNQLKTTAAYAADRKVLHQLITRPFPSKTENITAIDEEQVTKEDIATVSVELTKTENEAITATTENATAIENKDEAIVKAEEIETDNSTEEPTEKEVAKLHNEPIPKKELNPDELEQKRALLMKRIAEIKAKNKATERIGNNEKIDGEQTSLAKETSEETEVLITENEKTTYSNVKTKPQAPETTENIKQSEETNEENEEGSKDNIATSLASAATIAAAVALSSAKEETTPADKAIESESNTLEKEDSLTQDLKPELEKGVEETPTAEKTVLLSEQQSPESENNEKTEITAAETVAFDHEIASSITTSASFILEEENKPEKDGDSPSTFSGWLSSLSAVSPNIGGAKNEKRPSADKKVKNATQPKDKSKAIIENFLQKEPSISKPKSTFYNPANMAKQSIEEDITFVSETLAKIYMQQGSYKKALEAYQYLSLKYPEKRRTFADKIEEINNRIDQ